MTATVSSIDDSDGVDVIFGGNGNDQLTGGDLMFGGQTTTNCRPTNSRPVISAAPPMTTAWTAPRWATPCTAMAVAIYSNSGDGSDTLYGGSGNDFADGFVADDTMFGDAGDDRLDGNLGADLLFGGTGDDRLVGGNELDTLFGGLGDDTLSGGVASDGFVFGNDGPSTDVVDDFSQGVDVLDVSAVTHNGSHIFVGDFDGDSTADDSKVLLTQGASLNATIIVLDVTNLMQTDFIGL